jgi:hypothetical protein
MLAEPGSGDEQGRSVEDGGLGFWFLEPGMGVCPSARVLSSSTYQDHDSLGSTIQIHSRTVDLVKSFPRPLGSYEHSKSRAFPAHQILQTALSGL